jgi:hypothetical protein
MRGGSTAWEGSVTSVGIGEAGTGRAAGPAAALSGTGTGGSLAVLWRQPMRTAYRVGSNLTQDHVATGVDR